MKLKRGDDFFSFKYLVIILVVLIAIIWGYSIGKGFINSNVSGDVNFSFINFVAPTITIDSPISQVYKNNSYDINVTTNEAAYCQFAIDYGANVSLNATDSGANLTFFDNRSDVSEAVYKLTVFCNDSDGGRLKEVSFAISNDTETTTTTTTTTSSGGGGGGGGGGSRIGASQTTKYPEDLDAADIFGQGVIRLKASVSNENPIIYPIKVHNPYDETLSYVLESTNNAVVKASIEVFDIGADVKYDMSLVFSAPNELGVGIYSEKIKASSAFFNTELLVLYEIIDQDAPFELQVNSQSRIIEPGKILFFDVTPVRVDAKVFEVDMKYYLRGFNGLVLTEVDEENVLLEEGVTFTKSINIPDNSVVGEYALIAESKVNEIVVSGSDFVSVGKTVFEGYSLIILIALGFGALVLLYEWKQHQLKKILYYQHRLMAEVNSKLHNNEFHYLDALVEVEKLRWQKHLLDQAYAKGFIRKSAHQGQKANINSAISSLKKRYLY